MRPRQVQPNQQPNGFNFNAFNFNGFFPNANNGNNGNNALFQQFQNQRAQFQQQLQNQYNALIQQFNNIQRPIYPAMPTYVVQSPYAATSSSSTIPPQAASSSSVNTVEITPYFEQSTSPFVNLPLEILFYIANYLTPAHLAVLSQTNKELYFLLADNNLWETKFDRHFKTKKIAFNSDQRNWKQTFKVEFGNHYVEGQYPLIKAAPHPHLPSGRAYSGIKKSAIYSVLKELDFFTLAQFRFESNPWEQTNVQIDFNWFREDSKIDGSYFDVIKTINNQALYNFIYSTDQSQNKIFSALMCNQPLSVIKNVIALETLTENGGPSKRCALPLAAQHNRFDVVKYLVETFPHTLNSKDNLGQTALLWAASIGHLAMVDFLIAHYAELNHFTTEEGVDDTAKGFTAIYWATLRKHIAVVSSLLAAGASIDFNATKNKGLLHIAVQNNDIDMVDLLAQDKRILFQKTKNNITPLVAAIIKGNVEAFTILFGEEFKHRCMAEQRFPDVMYVTTFAPGQYFATLQHAPKAYALRLITKIFDTDHALEIKANLCSVIINRYPDLFIEVIKLLLPTIDEQTINVLKNETDKINARMTYFSRESTDKLCNMIMFSHYTDDIKLELIKILIRLCPYLVGDVIQTVITLGDIKFFNQIINDAAILGPDQIRNFKNNANRNLFLCAFYADQFQIAAGLIKYGFDVNLDENGEALLIRMIEKQNVKAVNFLIKHNANVYCLDNKNQPAIHLAAEYGNTHIVADLIRADINLLQLLNGQLYTPLLAAATNARRDVTNYLLTFCDFASEKGRVLYKIIEYICDRSENPATYTSNNRLWAKSRDVALNGAINLWLIGQQQGPLDVAALKPFNDAFKAGKLLKLYNELLAACKKDHVASQKKSV